MAINTVIRKFHWKSAGVEALAEEQHNDDDQEQFFLMVSIKHSIILLLKQWKTIYKIKSFII